MTIRRACDSLVNRQRLFRRLVLIWACWLVTEVALRATSPEALAGMSGPAASVVVAVIGILATVIAFYQWHRQADERQQTAGGDHESA